MYKTGELPAVVCEKVKSGNAIPQARAVAPPEYEEVHVKCCDLNPLLRPEFEEIRKSLQSVQNRFLTLPEEKLHLHVCCPGGENAPKYSKREDNEVGDVLCATQHWVGIKFSAVCLENFESASVFLCAYDNRSGQQIKMFELEMQYTRYMVREKWSLLSGQSSFPSEALSNGLQYYYFVAERRKEEEEATVEFVSRDELKKRYPSASSENCEFGKAGLFFTKV
eukprot:m.290283 g.290283  ORF g.290283 m.290283 type:complete len:223 (+) comp40716_c0_seq77:786-1454(+)